MKRAAFVAGAGAALAAAPRLAGAQGAAPLTTLRLGTSSGDDVTPVIYGIKSGIFARAGLELQIDRMTGAAAAALLGGSFDLGKSVITNILQAHVKELPLTVVAAASVFNPKAAYLGLLVRADAPLQSGKDFNNQVVGVGQLGDVSQIAMMAWVDAHGGDARSVKFTEIPTTAAPAAVLAGRVAAAESTQPMIAAALVPGDLRLLTVLDAFGPGSLMTAWATTRDTSGKHPDAIRAFARAYREAAAYTNAHHAETVDMMAAFTGAPASVIASMPRATAAPSVSAAQIQPVIDAAVKYGLLERAFPAGELIDPVVTGMGDRV